MLRGLKMTDILGGNIRWKWRLLSEKHYSNKLLTRETDRISRDLKMLFSTINFHSLRIKNRGFSSALKSTSTMKSSKPSSNQIITSSFQCSMIFRNLRMLIVFLRITISSRHWVTPTKECTRILNPWRKIRFRRNKNLCRWCVPSNLRMNWERGCARRICLPLDLL